MIGREQFFISVRAYWPDAAFVDVYKSSAVAALLYNPDEPEYKCYLLYEYKTGKIEFVPLKTDGIIEKIDDDAGMMFLFKNLQNIGVAAANDKNIKKLIK